MKKTNELLAAKTFLQARFPQGGRMLCAVSGGLDSMCLVHFMAGQPGFETAAAHFNHQLRGPAADRDEDFVRSWCAEEGIPFFTGTGDTPALMEAEGLSLRPRFSPGYGDFPLSMQTPIFDALDCPRKIGVSLNASLLMSPSKSVTAVIGLAPGASGSDGSGQKDCSDRREA